MYDGPELKNTAANHKTQQQITKRNSKTEKTLRKITKHNNINFCEVGIGYYCEVGVGKLLITD